MDSFYTVIRGDSLFGIAQRFYGDGNKFPIIAQANGIADPDRIFPGQVLVIPGIAGPPPPTKGTRLVAVVDDALVNYQLQGTKPYREFFAPNELPPADDPASTGNEVAVNIASCAQPALPVVHSVIPMFMWEQTSEPKHPFAIRRIRRSGVRIWLEHPWYSSGDGELLAVLTTGEPGLTPDEKVSLWARDPIMAGPKMTNSYEVPVLSAWQQRAAQLALTPLEGPGRPVMHVIKQRKSDQFADRDKVVNAYMFRPEFLKQRKLWFVDVVLDSTSAVWPFLRLSLARYQPNSIPGKEFSDVVATDFVQLPPERIATLSRPEANEVRVTVTGVTAVTAEPGADNR